MNRLEKEMFKKLNGSKVKPTQTNKEFAGKVLDLMVVNTLGHTHSVTKPVSEWTSLFHIAPKSAPPQEQKQKGNTMYRDYDTSTPSLASIEVDKRNHLEMRLERMYELKIEELKKHFGMNGVEAPKTIGELKKFIAEGRIQLHENVAKNYKDEYALDRWSNVFQYLVLTDPSIKKDEDGYIAAYAKLTKAYHDTQDIINIHDPIAGLEALKSFETQDFR